jgi:hypothetical protein
MKPKISKGNSAPKITSSLLVRNNTSYVEVTAGLTVLRDLKPFAKEYNAIPVFPRIRTKDRR